MTSTPPNATAAEREGEEQIQRFYPSADRYAPFMARSGDGDYVRYADHAATLLAAEESNKFWVREGESLLKQASAYRQEIDSLRAALLAARREEHAARARIAAHEAIFRWLQGEEGEFPESLPGKRYNFRTELSRRLAALATPATSHITTER